MINLCLANQLGLLIVKYVDFYLVDISPIMIESNMEYCYETV